MATLDLKFKKKLGEVPCYSFLLTYVALSSLYLLVIFVDVNTVINLQHTMDSLY